MKKTQGGVQDWKEKEVIVFPNNIILTFYVIFLLRTLNHSFGGCCFFKRMVREALWWWSLHSFCNCRLACWVGDAPFFAHSNSFIRKKKACWSLLQLHIVGFSKCWCFYSILKHVCEGWSLIGVWKFSSNIKLKINL